MADVPESLAEDFALDWLVGLIEQVEFGSNDCDGNVGLLHFGHLVLNFGNYRNLLPVIDEPSVNLFEHLESVCLQHSKLLFGIILDGLVPVGQ